jgi:hypothetical protein
MMVEAIMCNCIGMTIATFPVALAKVMNKMVASILLAF